MLLARDELDRRIVRLAIPALGTLALEPLFVLVDTAIVGRLGRDVLGGLGIASTVLLTVTGLAGFLQYAVTPDVAYAHGAGRPDEAKQAATDALVIGVGLGILAAVLLGFGAGSITTILGGEGGVHEAATTYLRISAVGLPFVLVSYVGHGVMRGLNLLRRPLLIVAAATSVNLVLEILFVIVFNWGVPGSAWSTVIAQVGGGAWFLAVLAPHLGPLRPAWQRYKAVLITGAHLAVRTIAMLAVWITATAVAARVDTPTLAANHVLVELFTFLALALDAFAIPAQSLVAGALGASDESMARRVGRACTRLSLWGAVGIAGALVVVSPVLPMVFTGDSAVRSRMTAGLLILAALQIPGAIAFALDGALIGARDEKFLGRIAIVNLLAFAPLIVATLVEPSLGIAGLWGAQLMWMAMRATVNHRRFASAPWSQLELRTSSLSSS